MQLFYYPAAANPITQELVRESVRKMKDGDRLQPMPRPAPLELTVCGMSINLIPAGSVVVVQNTTNDPVLSAKVASVAVDLMKERPDLRFVVIPADTRLEGIGLEHARLLRDRLNEIVYDQEKKA